MPTIGFAARCGGMFGLLCLALASAATAHADPLDTSHLPRLNGSDQVFAAAGVTYYTVPSTVARAVGGIQKLFAGDHWQQYAVQSSSDPAIPDFAAMSFKRGGDALSVTVSREPSVGDVTKIVYTVLTLDNDLPFPQDATAIEFDSTRPYLSCVTAADLDQSLQFFTTALTQLGWLPRPVNGEASRRSDNGVSGYFTRGEKRVLMLTLTRGTDRRTRVEIKPVSPDELVTTAAIAPPPADAPAPAPAQTPAKDEQRIEPAAGAPARAEVGAASSASPATTVVAVRTDELEGDEVSGLPVPKVHSAASASGGSPFRQRLQAAVPADLNRVLAFYRRELWKRNWKEDAQHEAVQAGTAVLPFASPGGPAVLKLAAKDGGTAIDLIVRNEAEASKAGAVPKPGQARVVFSNETASGAGIFINRRFFWVPPNVGTPPAKKAAPFDLPPGSYSYALMIHRKTIFSDRITIGADETWRLAIEPGAVMRSQLY